MPDPRSFQHSNALTRFNNAVLDCWLAGVRLEVIERGLSPWSRSHARRIYEKNDQLLREVQK